MGEQKHICDMTERETIETVLRLYTQDEKAVLNIGNHIAQILTRRRTGLRNRRREGR